MNRYIRNGVLADMRAGRRVIVITDGQASARGLLGTFLADLLPGERVHRTPGTERVETPDGTGRIWFRSGRAGARGMSADVIVLDTEPTTRQLEEILPAVGFGGEVIGP